MFAMALFAFFTLLIATIGVFMLARIFFFLPNKNRLKADLKLMKADMDKWANDLVPIGDEELEQFSFNQEKQVVRSGITKTARGIFTTIYHEPVMAYSYKKYPGSGRTALLYVRTANNDFVYHFNKNGVKVTIDGKEVGLLNDEGVLYGAKSKRMLGRINRKTAEVLPVIINDKEVASVAKFNATGSAKFSQRAFEFVREDLTEPEKEVFLSLGVLEVIEQSVKSK